MPYWYLKLGHGEKLPPLKQYDAGPKDCYWVRGVDSLPILVRGEGWHYSTV